MSKDEPFEPELDDELLLKIARSSIIFVDGFFSFISEESNISFLSPVSIFGSGSTSIGDSISDIGSNISSLITSEDLDSLVTSSLSSVTSVVVSFSSIASSTSTSSVGISSSSTSLSSSNSLLTSEISILSFPSSMPYSSGGGYVSFHATIIINIRKKRIFVPAVK